MSQDGGMKPSFSLLLGLLLDMVNYQRIQFSAVKELSPQQHVGERPAQQNLSSSDCQITNLNRAIHANHSQKQGPVTSNSTPVRSLRTTVATLVSA